MFNSLAAAVAAGMWMSAGLRGQNVTPPNMTATAGRAAATPAENPAAVPTATTPGAPLVAAGEARPAPGDWIMRDEAAKRALQLGFSPAAEVLLRELLESADTSDPVKNRLGLELTAALLDQGRLADAEQALARIPGARTAAHHLRAGLIAAYRKQAEPARSEAAQVKIDELPAPERGWFRFLEGMIADQAGDLLGLIRRIQPVGFKSKKQETDVKLPVFRQELTR